MNNDMFKHILKVKNPKGIHLNPATKIAQFAIKNKDLGLRLSRADREQESVDASSVMSILTLELNEGAEILLSMKKDSEEALRVISDLLHYDAS